MALFRWFNLNAFLKLYWINTIFIELYRPGNQIDSHLHGVENLFNFRAGIIRWIEVNWVAGVYVRKSKPSDVYLVLKTEILFFYRTTCYFLKKFVGTNYRRHFVENFHILKIKLKILWAFISLSNTENIEPCENLYGLRQISLNSGDKPDHTCIK